MNKYQYLFIIQGNYGQGWEDEHAETSRREARARLREYHENSQYPARLIKRRVPVQMVAQLNNECKFCGSLFAPAYRGQQYCNDSCNDTLNCDSTRYFEI